MTEPERILPGDATPLELGIADADARLDAIDTDLVRRIGGPNIAEVPEPYLSRRAWARSVDVWDQAWPEAVRRAVVVAAPEVHRLKGTPRSTELALEALQVTARITEWWELSPRGVPYTFDVLALARSRLYGGSPVLNEQVLRTVYDTVMRTKPLSRAFRLSIGLELTGNVGAAAAGVALLVDDHIVEAGPATGFAADASVAAAGVALLVDHHVADAGPAAGFETGASVAAAGVVLMADHRIAEAGPAAGFAAPAGLAAASVAVLLLSITAEAA